MNEIVSNSIFIKDLVQEAIEHKNQLKLILEDIKSTTSDKEVEIFLQKYWQSPKFKLKSSYEWYFEIDDLRNTGEQCYLTVVWDSFCSDDGESIPIEYFLDEQKLNEHIEKVTKLEKDRKLAEAKSIEDGERKLLARLKEKYPC
jgi:hypothetical protein